MPGADSTNRSGSRLRTLWRPFLALAAGAAMPVAFAPWTWSTAAILGPAVLFWLWRNSSPRAAFVLGWLFGMAMFGAGMGWLHISINAFGGVNPAGAALATMLLVAYLALFPGLTGWAARRWFPGSDSRVLLGTIPALWVLGEWIRGWLLTGLPWLSLGYSQIDTFAAGLAPVAGTFAVSWISALTAGALVLAVRGARRDRVRALLVAVPVWGAAALLGAMDWTQAHAQPKTATLIQGAIPQELKWQKPFIQRSLDRYRQLTEGHWSKSIIVWPETAIPGFEHQFPGYISGIAARARAGNADLYAGMPTLGTGGEGYYNSLVLISGRAAYHKRHLVPFGEYLPFKDHIGALFDFLRIPMSDFSPGIQDRPLINGRNAAAGISICFEDIFGEEVIEALPEAEILINVSNDAWFGNSAAPHQHLQMARMRALETGRYLLRATNTGISAIIDEKGKVTKQSIQFIPAVVSGEVLLFRGQTPYSRTGNWPVVLVAVLVLAAMRRRATG